MALSNQDHWLQSYPHFMRNDILRNLIGQTAIRFPANHVTSKSNVTYSASPLWVTLVPYVQDTEMWVTKTAPAQLMNQVIRNLKKLNVPFETCVID